MTKVYPPKILRSWGQRSTAGGPVAERRAEIEQHLPAPSYATGQQIGFFGHTQTGERRVVVVLAGDGAPTPVSGWAKIAEVQRFQRLSYTVPEGYDPYGLTVPIQFEAVKLVKGRKDLEQDIINMEWMTGRSPEGEAKGEPPYVEVYSVNAEGIQIPLVPRQFQGEPGRSKQWYMTLSFDANPERDAGGGRLRQKATATLKEISSTPSALQRNREAREAVKNKYYTAHAGESEDTIRRIAVGFGIPSSWQAILEANPSIGSAEKVLRIGTPVRIPQTAFRQVPA
jgi:hypothetical protein